MVDGEVANIGKTYANIYVYVYLAYLNIFPLRDSWSYFISEIWMSDIYIYIERERER